MLASLVFAEFWAGDWREAARICQFINEEAVKAKERDSRPLLLRALSPIAVIPAYQVDALRVLDLRKNGLRHMERIAELASENGRLWTTTKIIFMADDPLKIITVPDDAQKLQERWAEACHQLRNAALDNDSAGVNVALKDLSLVRQQSQIYARTHAEVKDCLHKASQELPEMVSNLLREASRGGLRR